MIITAVSASNVLKYAELHLEALPQQGLIAIEGANESGKSTIGETICFALFGRSFSLDNDELQKMIRWGETRCSASLTFKVGDEHYQINRYLDRDGNQGAKLSRADGSEQLLAKGIDTVESTLYELLGYGYDEFIESFYLAQREITTPHPHSYALKAMAGISSLEYAAAEYQEEIDSENESIDELNYEAGQIQEELSELAINPDDLSDLELARERLTQADEAYNADIESLESASSRYQDAIPRIRSARGARSRAGFFRFLFFLAMVVLGGSWTLMTQLPDNPYTLKLSGLLTQHLSFWNAGMVPWLLYGAVASVVIFLLLWIRISLKNTLIREEQVAGSTLADKLISVEQHTPRSLTQSEPEAEQDDASVEPSEADIERSDRGVEGEPPVDQTSQRMDSQTRTQLCNRIADCSADPYQVREQIGTELKAMRAELELMQEDLARVDQLIWREQERRKKGENLQQTIDSLADKIARHTHRVQLREVARELLDGSMRELSQKFNRDLRDLVSRTLPLFTDNRYEHLQIEDDLTVRVFSSEKRDFMDLEEISSGTQRQIMLAVRLALSQELVNSTEQGSQFIFLDEPFAFFDRERTLSALQVLPSLSDEITQIWIVAQEFPSELGFAREIGCHRDQLSIGDHDRPEHEMSGD